MMYRLDRTPSIRPAHWHPSPAFGRLGIVPNWAVLGLFDLDSSVQVYMRDLKS